MFQIFEKKPFITADSNEDVKTKLEIRIFNAEIKCSPEWINCLFYKHIKVIRIKTSYTKEKMFKHLRSIKETVSGACN